MSYASLTCVSVAAVEKKTRRLVSDYLRGADLHAIKLGIRFAEVSDDGRCADDDVRCKDDSCNGSGGPAEKN